MQKQVK